MLWTVARIREHSQVSNGALFHHFRSKEAIADSLYVEAMASNQVGGIITAAAHTNDEALSDAIARGIPVVLVGRGVVDGSEPFTARFCLNRVVR